MLEVKKPRCPKALPLLKDDQRVTIMFRGKRCCGFVTNVKNEPISRYVVTVVYPPWEFATAQEFINAMVARLHDPSGPKVWDYVYKRRDELEALVFGAQVAQGRALIQ
jgi:hypothetical protein